MTDRTDYASARRALRAIFVLAGHEIDGITNGQLASALDTSPSNVTRLMQMMQDEGVAERLPQNADRWRLTPRIVQVSVAMAAGIHRAARKAEEVQQRYSRTPY